MTLLRKLISIPTSVGDSDFVVKASEGADLTNYVVTDQLRLSFGEALTMVGHAVNTRRSQAKFLHGSFGSGKSHFMSVLREILRHNTAAREVPGLAEPIADADDWLQGRKVLCLTFHMLSARSVEQAVLEGYLNQITALHPEAELPAVHQSDSMLVNAAEHRKDLGDEKFFAKLAGGGAPNAPGTGLAAAVAKQHGWTPERYDAAVASPPGTKERDSLVSALTTAFYKGSVRSGEYLDLDTGLQVITRHAQSLSYDVVVLFLDELILWLSTRISDTTFVTTEGAKLNKLVESSDTARPLPLVSFVSRQRDLEEFLGPQVGGTERDVLAAVMRSVQGRFGSDIVLADTNLPEITERRLLRPGTAEVPAEQARGIIDQAFEAVRNNREVWDVLLSGAQYDDAGVGSDRLTFRRLYPFSPALVASLVALSQALQRERTALRVMTELLVQRRDRLAVNDLIGVAELFEPLVLRGELPDRAKLKQQFQAARDTYLQKLRPLVLALNNVTEAQSATSEDFQRDDRLVRTLLLGALVPEVPALHTLTASRLHALNFGSIKAPVPGWEAQIVIGQLTKLAADAGELQRTDGPDPVFSLKLSTVNYDRLLDLVPDRETTTGVLQSLVRDMVCAGIGIPSGEGTFGDLTYQRDWRGRRQQVIVTFANVRDNVNFPDSALYATGETWRVVVDYPFDIGGNRRDDLARIEQLDRGSRTVFWLPYFITEELHTRLTQLARINYLLGSGGNGDRLSNLATDWSVADRQAGKTYLQDRQRHLRAALSDGLRRAYGVVRAQATDTDVEPDDVGVLHTLAEGAALGDLRGGTFDAAFANLTADLLKWSYPGEPNLPEDERPVTRAELNKVLEYARGAAADEARRAKVETTSDKSTVKRISNHLRLGELTENIYVLNNNTCWWSNHLLQAAARAGYTDDYPVQVLRDLLERPARGFDRDLQNLILAVFALEQGLAWYQGTSRFAVQAVQQVTDALVLRRPAMPEPASWARAVERAKPIFGEALPGYLNPTTLAEFGTTIRRIAAQYHDPTVRLIEQLTEHAAILGIDADARTGRLATAKRVARVLRDINGESDDVVVVGLVAEADFGSADDIAASTAFKQAQRVCEALGRARWTLLSAMVDKAAADERAALIVTELRDAARREQNVAELSGALERAVTSTEQLLAMQPPPSITLPTTNPAQPIEPLVPSDSGKAVSDPEEHPKQSGGGTQPAVGRSREVTDKVAAQAVLGEIESLIAAGARVRISWEVLP
ncbi:phage resistance protein [Nocardia mangyaensis]|jgi:hypothetical protein|uniref:Phage resistance protein n=1 Tax=Nocardia mangyaensis TaxID=2213200 RepID=A0A1J0VYP2_9NOCA|nr:phage resistance protein [Nocardia mangyaensis]APE37126.1 phage resistance protein [Nocardia mangyaensis]MBC7299326.1 phage resistance protein [Nocardia sp.]